MPNPFDDDIDVGAVITGARDYLEKQLSRLDPASVFQYLAHRDIPEELAKKGRESQEASMKLARQLDPESEEYDLEAGIRFLLAESILPLGKIPQGSIQALRKQVMAPEIAARGPKYKPKVPDTDADFTDWLLGKDVPIPRAESPLPTEYTKELTDEMARGLWFHGRGTYPATGETFAASRMKTGNLGEPAGISLTMDKELLAKHFAVPPRHELDGLFAKIEKATSRRKEIDLQISQIENLEELAGGEVIGSAKKSKLLGQLEDQNQLIAETRMEINRLEKNPPFGRVFPRFGGPPAERILPAWKGPETEWAQEVLKDTYEEAANKIYTENYERLVKEYGQEKADKWLATFPKKGPKAVAELKQRLEIYKLDEFNAEISAILQRKGYKALLYSPDRFGEYELRMLDPADVTMLDLRRQADPGLARLTRETAEEDMSRPHKTYPGWGTAVKKTGPQTRRKTRIEEATAGKPSSLRDIYQDINIQDVLKIALDVK